MILRDNTIPVPISENEKKDKENTVSNASRTVGILIRKLFKIFM